MPYSIMLDAGHGGRDPGAVYKERKEKDDTLRLTLAVGEILEAHGLDVQYTRTTDVYESPYQKAMEANNAGVDFFVSIHRNSFPSDNVIPLTAHPLIIFLDLSVLTEYLLLYRSRLRV